MKAVICTKYGGPEVLKIKELNKPAPKNNEILIKVKASSITTAETMMRRGTPKFGRLFLGLTKPKASITGTGYAGTVEAIGENIRHFNIGDNVFGETALGFGTNADYICISEDSLILTKPKKLSFEQAATLCDGALTASNFINVISKIKPGQSILINGASGSIGSAAVQIAKRKDIYVTGVCSTNKISYVSSLGADKIIDYTAKDFTKDEKSYDIVFDTIGKSSFCSCRKVLKKNGTYISPVLSLKLLLQMTLGNLITSQKVKFSATGLKPVKELKPLLEKLVHMTDSGILDVTIDRTYSMHEVVEAHKYVDAGHKKGNVVLVH